MSLLTGWDWFVGVVALLSIGIGLIRGFVRTVFALAGWLAAAIATPILSPILVAMIGMQDNPWVIYVLVFVGVLLLIRLTGGMLARALGRAGLGGADRAMGALLGAARALLLIGLAAIAAKVAGLSETVAWKDALCRPMLDGIVQWAQPYLPEKLSGIRKT